MATFSFKLTSLNVDAWFPPDEPIEEQLIKNGTGIYTVSIFGRSVGYYLQVDSGDRVNPLRLGQAVRATGRDSDGKLISTAVMETTSTGNPALFKGPYQAALGGCPNCGSGATATPATGGALGVVVGGAPGAQFWAYISPSNNTSKWITSWKVTLSQGNWQNSITSANPQQMLQTPGLSGIFDVVVTASGPNMPEKQLSVQAGSNPNIGCNNNCASMVGIVSNETGTDAQYWTVWDAYCSRG